MSEGFGVRLVALTTLALLSAGAHAQEVPLKCEPRRAAKSSRNDRVSMTPPRFVSRTWGLRSATLVQSRGAA